jgi:hypothetical protein
VLVEPSQFGGFATPSSRRITLIAPVWELRIQFHSTPATATGRICGR